MEHQKEIWKDIEGYEGKYQVSNKGQIKSLKRFHVKKDRIVTPGLPPHGYKSISLYNSGDKTFLVHRLVAKAFIPNPKNKRTINHINGIKTDNRIENLEWATYSENHKHAYKIGIKISEIRAGVNHNSNKLTKQYDMNGEFIQEYFSQTEASRQTNIDNSAISLVCRGIRRSAGGYIWKFA